MRFSNLPTLLICLLMFASLGCRNTTSLQCEREMALLRSEILDLEDKYYALKSRYENGLPATGVVAASTQWPVMVSGDVIYDDQIVDGQIIDGQVYDGQIIEGPIYGNEVLLPGTEIIDNGAIGSGVITSSTMAPMSDGAYPELVPESADGFELDLNDRLPAETAPSTADNSDQAVNLLDGPEWEIGYEDPSDGIATVDRIEIVSSQTRGKDLDQRTGDDGVEVMVQTLDIDNNFVDAEGELTVTVVDRRVGQIGKWTFLPEELKLFLSRDEFDNLGILLNLPWADASPVSSVIDVQVSMIVNGVEYSDSKRVRIQTAESASGNQATAGWPGKQGGRWTKGASLKSSDAGPALKPRSTSIERPKWKPVR